MASPTQSELAHAKMFTFMMGQLYMNKALDDVRLADVRAIAKDAAGMASRMIEKPDFWKND